MVITVDILKKINRAIVEGKPLSLEEAAVECGLDTKMLTIVAGDLSQKIHGMAFFFSTMESYLIELDTRVRRLNMGYREIQKLQIEHGIIKAQGALADPPIKW